MYPFIHIGWLQLGTYGICAGLGFVAAYWIFRANLIRHGIRKEIAGLIMVAAGLSGIAGAKIYFLFETAHPLRNGLINALMEPSGISWLGGFVTALSVVCLLAIHYKITVLTMLDLSAPAGAIAFGFGRLGCLMSGDGDYGVPTSLPWGMSFPHGIVPTLLRVHPTPIYEAIFSFGLCWLSWRLGSRERSPGLIAALYLVLSGIGRFAVEFIKLNPTVFLGLTNPQIVSIGCVAVGGALLWYSIRREALRRTVESDNRAFPHPGAEAAK